MFNIKVETTRDKLMALPPKKVISAEVRAINNTARGLRTQISKRVRAEVALKASVVKESLSLQKARWKPRPSATLAVKSKPIPLKHYGARQVRKGTTVRVKKAGGRKLIRHAFIVGKIGSHAFQRKGKARLPIKKLFGPSVRDEVDQLAPVLEDYIHKTLDKQIKQAIGWEIEKQIRKNLR